MKLRYKKGRLIFYKFMLLFWLLLAISNLLFNEVAGWSYYILSAISISYVVAYSYNLINQYITIQDEILKENHFFGKKINLNEIKSIKKFAGDYILKTDKTELTINTQIIDEKSLEDLNQVLDTLDLK